VDRPHARPLLGSLAPLTGRLQNPPLCNMVQAPPKGSLLNCPRGISLGTSHNAVFCHASPLPGDAPSASVHAECRQSPNKEKPHTGLVWQQSGLGPHEISLDEPIVLRPASQKRLA